MEVPLADFGHLPENLGCSLHRSAQGLTLASEQPGCAMHFRLDGEQARLDSVEVMNDPEGRFFRDVVGLVMQIYSGDLDAELTWSPEGTMEERVQMRGGELQWSDAVPAEGWATDPKRSGGSDEAARPREIAAEEPQVEQWLAEARSAWKAYLLFKSRPEA